MNRVLVIDNYDSFTFNLVQALLQLGAEVVVRRNDAVTVAEAGILAPTHLVVSPGPGSPRDSGVSCDLIREFAPLIPVLGVCLGHQAIAEVFGGRVVRAPSLVHGKPASIRHDGGGLFVGLPNPLIAGRYHSLAACERSLPDCLQITARSDDGVIMGLRHRSLPVEGVQFHPESVLTPQGPHLLARFLEMRAPAASRARPAPLSREAAA